LSGPERRIVLSEQASRDIADILQYTLETWGERQMDVYAARLEKGFRLLGARPLLGKPRRDLYPGCRCYRIEQHLVLYEVDEEEIRVARFLHKRMDVKLHP
jgi:toxin ParE1/3/4